MKENIDEINNEEDKSPLENKAESKENLIEENE